MSEILQSVPDGRLLRLTLNRPEKRNALNLDLCRALVGALEVADRDPAVGAILLAANGPSFCAGMDIQEVAHGGRIPQEFNDALAAVHEQLFTINRRLSKPLIAAVHGAALGGGMGLVANCHVVIAGQDATFGLTEIRLGLWPFLVFRSVTAALGERRSIELSLTGRVFGAREAVESGLAHEVAIDLEARATEVALGIAESSPTAIKGGLRCIQAIRGEDWGEAARISHMVRRDVFASPDFAEGMRAFREKRKPHWPSISRPEPRRRG